MEEGDGGNTGSPVGGVYAPTGTPRGAGRAGRVAEGLVLPRMPDNAGGGKEPWFESDTGRMKGVTTGESLPGSEKVRKLQTVLHAKAKEEPGRRFHALIDKVWREDFLAKAWRRVRRNGGSAGVDGETYADIESYGVGRWLGELARDLKDGTYTPKPVRQVLIPKKQPGKFRPLGSRAWLWASVSSDAVSFHIDPSRSAEAAQKLFGDALLDTVIVCDRYSAYKRLARLRAGKVTLAFCWSHMRRDFVECAAGQVRLTDWCQGWIERIASIYRLNEARLAHYDPVIERQTPAFDAAQGALKEALDGLFAEAARELVGLPDQAREGKALRSLRNHREGLSVFVDRPQVPLDNNRAERFLRGPAIGRRLSFGSDSEDGARFTAIMYSVVGTLSMNGINILSWLDAWLAACAENDRKPPDNLSPWLPWSMSEERRRELMAPA